MKNYIGTYYTIDYLQPDLTKKYINLAIQFLQRPENIKRFDSIAFTGMSGASLAIIIAHSLNKELIMVRKPGCKSHSSCTVEGYAASKKYIIIDDVISTGYTAKRIQKKIHTVLPKTKCIGILSVCGLRKNILNNTWDNIVDTYHNIIFKKSN